MPGRKRQLRVQDSHQGGVLVGASRSSHRKTFYNVSSTIKKEKKTTWSTRTSLNIIHNFTPDAVYLWNANVLKLLSVISSLAHLWNCLNFLKVPFFFLLNLNQAFYNKDNNPPQFGGILELITFCNIGTRTDSKVDTPPCEEAPG